MKQLRRNDYAKGIGARAFMALVLLVLMGACAAPPTPDVPLPTDAPPAVSETPPPAAAAPPAATDSPAPPEDLISVPAPPEEQLKELVASFDAPERADPGHVPPPRARVDDLERLCNSRDDAANQDSCQFLAARATTYVQPGQGALLQLLSLAEPLDDWLKRMADPGGWPPELGLVVGGLAVYQGFTYQTTGGADAAQAASIFDGELGPGNYLVILYRQDDLLWYELYSDSVRATGEWQMRRFMKGVNEQHTLITPRQVCFSQLELQPCLNLRLPGIGQGGNVDLAGRALRNLAEAGLIRPESVRLASALASVEGIEYVNACASALAETSQGLPEQCQPSFVAAVADPLEDDQFQNVPAAGVALMSRSPGLAATALQPNEAISETIPAIGVIEVLAPLEVVDADGNDSILPPGSYRIDLLHLQDEALLVQFVPASGDVLHYAQGWFVEGEGELVDADMQPLDETGDSELLLDGVLYSVCHKFGKNKICNNQNRKRPVCFVWGKGVGWCDVIGAG